MDNRPFSIGLQSDSILFNSATNSHKAGSSEAGFNVISLAISSVVHPTLRDAFC
nr:MAG TPA: hypothetical protein [Caudoviricetes sp.]